MDSFTFEFTPAMGAIVLMIGMVIQMLKPIAIINKYCSEYYPLMSGILGVVMAWQQGIVNPIVSGILMGAAASGLYKVLSSSNQPKDLISRGQHAGTN